MKKREQDNLIQQYKVQPVGRGYIDCIVSMENVFQFIGDLSKINVNIHGLTWWCHCKDQDLAIPAGSGTSFVALPFPWEYTDSACPCGMGGPVSVYYEGWFSEICAPMIEFEDNEQVTAYLKESNDSGIRRCFVPGLWLDVPDDWKNELEGVK